MFYVADPSAPLSVVVTDRRRRRRIEMERTHISTTRDKPRLGVEVKSRARSVGEREAENIIIDVID